MKKLKTSLVLLSFTCLGVTKAQWTDMATPASYHLYCIEAASDNIIYAGGYGGSLVKTTNAGDTWESLSIGSTNWISAVHFMDEENGWIVTNPPTADENGDIMFTNDGGETWTSSHSDYSYSSMFWVDATTCYIGTWDGHIIKSTNAGDTWTAQPAPSTENIPSLQFIDSENGFALSTDYKLMRTNDSGETWESFVHYGLRDFFFFDMMVGFAIDEYGRIAKTVDGGVSFTFEETPFPDFKLLDIYFVNEDFGYIVGGLDCGDGSCVPSPVILTTTDGGETWLNNSHPLEGMDRGFYAVDVTPNGTPFLAGSNKMVMKNEAFVSLESSTKAVILNVYPNPNSGTFNVGVSQGINSLTILNGLGEIIDVFSVQPESTTTVYLENITPGLYFIQATGDNNSISKTQKILIN